MVMRPYHSVTLITQPQQPHPQEWGLPEIKTRLVVKLFIGPHRRRLLSFSQLPVVQHRQRQLHLPVYTLYRQTERIVIKRATKHGMPAQKDRPAARKYRFVHPFQFTAKLLEISSALAVI